MSDKKISFAAESSLLKRNKQDVQHAVLSGIYMNCIYVGIWSSIIWPLTPVVAILNQSGRPSDT